LYFFSTCEECQVFAIQFKVLNIESEYIHAQLAQRKRVKAINRFKSSLTRILLATDVASRGLDIPKCGIVINYHVPHSTKQYVHRIGRTARAGRGGTALLLVSQYEIKLLQNIEAHIGKKLKEYPTNEKEVLLQLNEVITSKQQALGTLEREGYFELHKQFQLTRSKRRLEDLEHLNFNNKKQKINYLNTSFTEDRTTKRTTDSDKKQEPQQKRTISNTTTKQVDNSSGFRFF